MSGGSRQRRRRRRWRRRIPDRIGRRVLHHAAATAAAGGFQLAAQAADTPLRGHSFGGLVSSEQTPRALCWVLNELLVSHYSGQAAARAGGAATKGLFYGPPFSACTLRPRGARDGMLLANNA